MSTGEPHCNRARPARGPPIWAAPPSPRGHDVDAVSPADARPMRRSTDAGEPTNREILTRLEEFINEHRADHNALERRLNQHDMETVGHVKDISAIQDVIRTIAPELATLHDFRTQVMTLGTLMKVLVGTSVLGAILTVATLVSMFAHVIAEGH